MPRRHSPNQIQDLNGLSQLSDIIFDKVLKEENLQEVNLQEIIVRCIPELPENSWIDEDENLHVSKEIILAEFSLFDQKTISIMIGKKNFEIPVKDLWIRRNQLYILKGQGITKGKNSLGEELNRIEFNKNQSKSCFENKNIIVHINIV